MHTFYKKNISGNVFINNKNIKKGLFLFSFFFFVNVGFGQNNAIISGIVIDKSNNSPVPFCNVYIENSSVGTITNDQGKFRLAVPKYINKDLCISFIGYKTKKIALEKLKSKDNVITLSKDKVELAEVIIMPDSTLLTFLRKAYRAINKNYPQIPTKSQGFYRETQENDQNEYLYFSEAILNVFKNSYRFSDDPGQIEIIESRKKEFPVYRETNNIRYYAGAHIPVNRDFVYKRTEFINPKHFNRYDYQLSNISKLDGRTLYEISFDTNNDSLKGSYKGKFYIDKESLAYVMAEYDLTERGIKKYNNIKINAHKGIKKSYFIQYFYFNNKWHLKYCKHNEDAINTTYKSNLKRANEFLTTNIITDSVKPIPYEKQIGYYDIFLDTAMPFDSTNWNDYNIVKTNDDLLYSIEQAKSVFNQKIEPPKERLLFKIVTNFHFNYGIAAIINNIPQGQYQINLDNANLYEDIKNKDILLALIT